MDRIKTCPFCGSKAELICREEKIGDIECTVAFVQCRNCYAKSSGSVLLGLEQDREIIENVIRDWNFRVPDEKSKAHWMIDATSCSCSACKAKIPKTTLSSIDFKYCPNCGSPI